MTSLPWSQYPLKVLFFEESAYKLWIEQAKPSRQSSRPTPGTDHTLESADSIVIGFRPEGVDGMRKKRRGIATTNQDQTKPIEVHDEEAMLDDYEKIEEIKKRIIFHTRFANQLNASCRRIFCAWRSVS